MPFPLIPFLMGAAAGALATYLRMSRREQAPASKEAPSAPPAEKAEVESAGEADGSARRRSSAAEATEESSPGS